MSDERNVHNMGKEALKKELIEARERIAEQRRLMSHAGLNPDYEKQIGALKAANDELRSKNAWLEEMQTLLEGGNKELAARNIRIKQGALTLGEILENLNPARENLRYLQSLALFLMALGRPKPTAPFLQEVRKAIDLQLVYIRNLRTSVEEAEYPFPMTEIEQQTGERLSELTQTAIDVYVKKKPVRTQLLEIIDQYPE